MTEATQTATAEKEWAAWAAIDWADQKHAWILLPAGEREPETGEVESTPEAVDAWAAELQQRFAGRPVAVCLEQRRGPLVYMLAKYAHLVLFTVHPTTAAQYRETFAPSGAKDDRNDAASLLDLLLRHRDRLRPLEPDTVETRLIQFLAEERRQMVDLKTAQSNRLKACLKLYFPQILQWFGDVSTPLVGDLLERWPTLEQLQRSHPGTLGKFFREHNCRSQEWIEERVAAIRNAVPATNDQAALRAGVATARGLVGLIEKLRSHIASLDQQLAELAAEHPDGALFRSFPGAGKVLVPRLIAAFGTRRERFDKAYEVQCYSGIAPVTRASGNNHQVHFRWACPKFLRQTFHEYAGHSLVKSPWARAFYDHLRQEEHKNHHAAVRALAYKWIRIIFRCWKDGKPYDERIHLQSLERHGQARVGLSAVSTKFKWNTVAGFQKFSTNNS
ncbi:MAG TPA: IS110 family transposase [Terriglobales bacterium]|nr:IS110 family transposase [Terriglobales bacterium]